MRGRRGESAVVTRPAANGAGRACRWSASRPKRDPRWQRRCIGSSTPAMPVGRRHGPRAPDRTAPDRRRARQAGRRCSGSSESDSGNGSSRSAASAGRQDYPAVMVRPASPRRPRRPRRLASARPATRAHSRPLGWAEPASPDALTGSGDARQLLDRSEQPIDSSGGANVRVPASPAGIAPVPPRGTGSISRRRAASDRRRIVRRTSASLHSRPPCRHPAAGARSTRKSPSTIRPSPASVSRTLVVTAVPRPNRAATSSARKGPCVRA